MINEVLKIEIIKSDELTRLSDLMKIRSSYPIEDENISTMSNRYLCELGEKDNRIFFVGYDSKNTPFGYVQLIILNADNIPNWLMVSRLHIFTTLE